MSLCIVVVGVGGRNESQAGTCTCTHVPVQMAPNNSFSGVNLHALHEVSDLAT